MFRADLWRISEIMMRALKVCGAAAVCLLFMEIQLVCCMAWSEPEELRYEDFAEPKKVVLVYDNSGSAWEVSALDHDIKYIFYSVLWEDALTDCSIFQFNQDVSHYEYGDVWNPKLSRRETDLVGGLEAVNWYLEHGKEAASIVLVSDLYDTYAGRKLDVLKDVKLIEERKNTADKILKGWKDNSDYDLHAYTWKSQKEEAADFTQLNLEGSTRISLDKRSIKAAVRECFEKAQQLRTGVEDIHWKEFSEIPLEEEEEYVNYYIWSEDALLFGEKEKGYVTPILEKTEAGGHFYLVEGLPLSELGFHRSWKEIYLMQEPKLQIQVEYDQALDQDTSLHTDRLAAVHLSITWCGKELEQEGLTFRLQKKAVDGSDKAPEEVCTLEYDPEEKSYVGYFTENNSGDYQLKLYFNKESGTSKIVETRELPVFLPNMRLYQNVEFMEELRKIEISGAEQVELPIAEYISPRIEEGYVCSCKLVPVDDADEKIRLKCEVSEKGENGSPVLLLTREDIDPAFSGVVRYWADIEIRYMDEDNKWNGSSYHEEFLLRLHAVGNNGKSAFSK